MIEASTKSGKTVGAFIWLVHQALHGKPGVEHWWVAPYHQQAEIAFRRVARGLAGQHGVLPRVGTKRIILPNGSRISFKSGEDSNTLYGEDVYSAVIDEASRVREEAWHAVRSTLTATQGPCRMVGNVTDRKNWFFRMCRAAESGSSGHRYAKILAADAVAAGVLDAGEIDQARADLPEHVFAALYECVAPETGLNPFGTDAEIDACTAPLSDLPPMVQGWDLARDRNWTVGVGLDALGQVSMFERWHGSSWKQTTERIVQRIGESTALLDQTGPGSAVTEAVQDRSDGAVQGFTFTAQSKQRIMEQLALAIQRRDIRFPPGPLTDELKAFTFEATRTGVRYTAPAGLHDDCVDALALAVEGWRNSNPVRITRVH